jgi:hypothetical protein
VAQLLCFFVVAACVLCKGGVFHNQNHSTVHYILCFDSYDNECL